ncbi:SET and MYND domain-containing protein 4-like [Battus philenor]|uniref:SET and MYND domain-containing protein 4-like n=1 Tax=Battus philenor TaxID=42288 RepID=UPI0035D03027
MFNLPSHFNQYLQETRFADEIYNAMALDDYSEVVLAAYNILEKTDNFPKISKVNKSEEKSNRYRDEGNKEFKSGNINKAMEYYNKALMYAPKHSRSELLVYSNRSAILNKVNLFSACVVDIEMCFKLGCPQDLLDKLNNRLKHALVDSENEKKYAEKLGSYCHNFYKISGKNNPEIPCASTDIEVNEKDNVKKIVAAKDIKIGTVLAKESSFVSSTNQENYPFACHYCQKMSLNLIPCYDCCFVLFCNENCRELCHEEYHSVECQIMEIIEEICISPMAKLMVKGVIKFVKMSSSWKEVISNSHCTGSNRISISTVQEMFDVGNKLSILSFADDKIFIYGSMYDASFVCATIIYYLEKLPRFLSGLLGEKRRAKQALARMMMYFAIYVEPTPIISTVANKKLDIAYHHPQKNYGWYPFIGKLKKSCTPNVMVSYLNKKAVLIALRPIKKGSELTCGNMPREDHSLHSNNCQLFVLNGKVCKCIVCSGDWRKLSDKCILTEKQRDIYINKFLNQNNKINILTLPHVLPNTIEVMTKLNNVTFSNEYRLVCEIFCKCLITCEEFLAGNIILDQF